ncbi:hypothetical protein B2J93_9148 [Marssonina coronariae]|uniref:Uncharacterized protein n=1 Tax=Diplocarpon coronariae TaxID=2795749 RepID=A0A218YSR7_9HELO|nr:hypothetical protein B2J93_9148 [Marssonina coronariae]
MHTCTSEEDRVLAAVLVYYMLTKTGCSLRRVDTGAHPSWLGRMVSIYTSSRAILRGTRPRHGHAAGQQGRHAAEENQQAGISHSPRPPAEHDRSHPGGYIVVQASDGTDGPSLPGRGEQGLAHHQAPLDTPSSGVKKSRTGPVHSRKDSTRARPRRATGWESSMITVQVARAPAR